jgi:integrase
VGYSTGAIERARGHSRAEVNEKLAKLQRVLSKNVKNLLGHSTIVPTSNTYRHVLEQRQQEMGRGMDAVLGG